MLESKLGGGFATFHIYKLFTVIQIFVCHSNDNTVFAQLFCSAVCALILPMKANSRFIPAERMLLTIYSFCYSIKSSSLLL